jgi:hypothetical protein
MFKTRSFPWPTLLRSGRRCNCPRLSGLLVPAPFLGQRWRIVVHRDGGQPRPKTFERVVAPRFTCKRIKAVDFAVARGENCPVLEDDVYKIEAFEACRPNLSACGTVQSDY